MTAQTTNERYWDRLMDADLAKGFHATCENCGKNMDYETGDAREKCREKEIEEND